jgi:hypothetical protein
MRERDRAHNDSRVIWGPAEGDATFKNATLLRCLLTLVMPPDRTFERAYSPQHKDQRVDSSRWGRVGADSRRGGRRKGGKDGFGQVTSVCGCR